MKQILFFSLFILYSVCFAQTKQEHLIDSVLVANISKTYDEYVNYLEQQKHKLTPSASEMEKIRKKNGIYPSFSMMYYSQECPLVMIKEKNNQLSNVIYPSFKNKFNKVKNVYHTPPSPKKSALYSSNSQYGVFIIEVE